MFPVGFSFFSSIDLLSIVVWLTVVLLIAHNKRTRHSEEAHYKWYLKNVYANLFMGILFGILYINLLGGGDTEAYYMGSTVLSNLFLKSPGQFIEFINMEFSHDYTSVYFTPHTGYPPGWIFREDEGFFVSKLLVSISLICFKSYWSMTILLSFLSAQASWKLYEFARSYNINDDRLLAFGTLLLPSVNFWCSGVGKDSIVYIATIYLIYHAFQIISAERQATFKNYFYALFCALLIYKIRSFILAAIFIPMVFSLSARIVKSFGGGDNSVIFIRSFVLLVSLAIGGRTLINSNVLAESSALQQAAVIQDDFAHNELYGDKKYDIGTIEFTALGLLKITPFAIIAGIYKPLFWEARSATLVMNGLESIVFLYFTILFFRGKFIQKWKKIRSHEFLIFCLIFVIIIAFMTGLTSGLFGVLVRLRAPLLPFFFIILTTNIGNKEEDETIEAKVLTEKIS